ncbi:alpha/beta hydrolase [Neolewinella antarctica]|uniref:Serine aminopeptidase S33 domain-containing protein n=1 Tax=Neolewinella antarctica TaxID=442734 RepID=A0ABX0X816_9BACT|nr:alpha/beta fold hydrolase [Neolewinella antarctica]NJC25146.1 hypothetical protein [Neolewinella antarctica]
MRVLKGIFITLAVIYVALATLIYAKQESLIFHPRARAIEYSYGNYPEEWVEVEPGIRLNAMTVAAAGEVAPGVILYLHGNVGDNGRSLYQTRSLVGMGYDLFLVDYRGFGKSEGRIGGEENMTDDLQIVYDHLKDRYGEENIVIVGYSLGTGPGTFLAARNNPRGVVLVAPYLSLTAMKGEFFWMFPDFLLNYELNNERHLAEANCPVTIIHGTGDRLIPVEMSQRLAAVDPVRIELVELNGVGHRGAILSSELAVAVGRYVRAE